MKVRTPAHLACAAGVTCLFLLSPPGRDAWAKGSSGRGPVASKGTQVVGRSGGIGPAGPARGNLVSLRSKTVESLIQQNTNGKFGYYLKEVNGSVLLAHNSDAIFYPASTFKVLIHGYTMRQVMNGKIALSHMIDVKQEDGTIQKMELQKALTGMMVPSHNPEANALIDLWGMKALNSFAVELELQNAAFRNHYAKGHCGKDYAISNTLTLNDAGRFYEAVLKQKFLSGPSSLDFFRLMNHAPAAVGMIDWAINQEALSLGVSAAKKKAFRNGIFMIWKSGGSGANGKICQSRAGLIMLPGNHAKGVKPLWAVFGFFTERAAVLDNEPNLSEIVIGEMLRNEIRPRLLAF